MKNSLADMMNQIRSIPWNDLDGLAKFDVVMNFAAGMVGGSVGGRCGYNLGHKVGRHLGNKFKDYLLENHFVPGAPPAAQEVFQELAREMNLKIGIRSQNPIAALGTRLATQLANTRFGKWLGLKPKPGSVTAQNYSGVGRDSKEGWVFSDQDIAMIWEKGKIVVDNRRIMEIVTIANQRLKARGLPPLFQHGAHSTALQKYNGPATMEKYYDYRTPGPMDVYDGFGRDSYSHAAVYRLFKHYGFEWPWKKPPGANMRAGGGPAPDTMQDPATLTYQEAVAATAAAQSLWRELGLTSLPLDLIVVVEDLPGNALGEARAGTVDAAGRSIAPQLALDVDGAGAGWFVDATPGEQEEFLAVLGETIYEALAETAAAGRYDLFTVILHELAHLAGFATADTSSDEQDHLHFDDHGWDLMNAELSPGMRMLPSERDLELLGLSVLAGDPGDYSYPDTFAYRDEEFDEIAVELAQCRSDGA